MPKSKMTETNIARILVMLMQGNTRETASLSVGISPRTLQEWMRDNPEIADQIYEAEANCESQYVNVVHETAIGGGKQALSAAILMLERRNPAAWGRSTRNDAFTRDQQVRELAEELRREGISITDEQAFKELSKLEHKALPSGKKP